MSRLDNAGLIVGGLIMVVVYSVRGIYRRALRIAGLR